MGNSNSSNVVNKNLKDASSNETYLRGTYADGKRCKFTIDTITKLPYNSYVSRKLTGLRFDDETLDIIKDSYIWDLDPNLTHPQIVKYKSRVDFSSLSRSKFLTYETYLAFRKDISTISTISSTFVSNELKIQIIKDEVEHGDYYSLKLFNINDSKFLENVSCSKLWSGGVLGFVGRCIQKQTLSIDFVDKYIDHIDFNIFSYNPNLLQSVVIKYLPKFIRTEEVEQAMKTFKLEPLGGQIRQKIQ